MKNKVKGELVEQIVITELMKLGVIVSKPIGDNQPYDIIVEHNNILYKVQIRTLWKEENRNSLKLSFLSRRINTKKSYSTSNKDKVDFYIGYSFETEKCYVVRTNEYINSNSISLQLGSDIKYGKNKNYATDFELNKIFI